MIDIERTPPGQKQSHLEWARLTALSYARSKGVPRDSPDADDFVGAALLLLARGASRFTDDGEFRRWCYRGILRVCRDVLMQLRSGGTFGATDRNRVAGVVCEDWPAGLEIRRDESGFLRS